MNTLYDEIFNQSIQDFNKQYNLLNEIEHHFPDNESIAAILSRIYTIYCISSNIDLDSLKEIVNMKMKDLYNQYSSNKDIVINYAICLICIEKKQNDYEASKTVDIVKELYTKYLDNDDVVQLYGQALSILSIKQGNFKGLDTLALLQDLSYRYPDNEILQSRLSKTVDNFIKITFETTTEEIL